jgi:hypothetical protein
MSSDHQLTALDALYGRRGAYTASCVCGWQSTEQATAGKATIVGWRHINSSPAEIDQGSEAGLESSPATP